MAVSKTLATYWNMVINNPDENDYVLVRNPMEKFVRQIIWTTEKGAQGTEHIQAFVRLQRNQTMAFMKKMFPRGHFKFISKDEYLLHSITYAQKDDETTQGKHVNTINEGLQTPDSLYLKILREVVAMDEFDSQWTIAMCEASHRVVRDLVSRVEHRMVREKPAIVRLLLSPMYEQIKRYYTTDFIRHIVYNNAVEVEEEQEVHVSQAPPS